MQFKEGDVIGQKYEVHKVLGKGGFGVVYLVFSRPDQTAFALKTFLQGNADAKALARFRQEAEVWVQLGAHPYLVQAYFVEEIEGRLYIAMEYIGPGAHKLNTLEGYLRYLPPDVPQALRWTIQLCHGMEYAGGRGIRSHRDLKPANVMITPDRDVKITDFGLATRPQGFDSSGYVAEYSSEARQAFFGQTMRGIGFGTPTHMPPEQFEDVAQCDERSDIYSTGVMLYQMVTRGQLPVYLPWPEEAGLEARMRYWKEMETAHRAFQMPRLGTPADGVLQRCLRPDPAQRYQTYAALRQDLEQVLHQMTGEAVPSPPIQQMGLREWLNRGRSLQHLRHFADALGCYDEVLRQDRSVMAAWRNKGMCLCALGQHKEANAYFQQAYQLAPQDTENLNAWGHNHRLSGDLDAAITCFDKTLEVNERNEDAWAGRGQVLWKNEQRDEALQHFNYALQLNPRFTEAWVLRGELLQQRHQYDEALAAFDDALRLNNATLDAWAGKAHALAHLGRLKDALECYDYLIEQDRQNAVLHAGRGSTLAHLGQYHQAAQAFDAALHLAPEDSMAQFGLGNTMLQRHRYDEAVACYDAVLARDEAFQPALHNRGLARFYQGRFASAEAGFTRALHLDRDDPHAWNNRALALLHLGRRDEALQNIEFACGLDGQEPLFAFNQGNLLYHQRRYEAAVAAYDAALNHDALRADTWYNRGLALLWLDRITEALEAFDKAEALAQQHTAYWQRRAQQNGTAKLLRTLPLTIDRLPLDPRATLLRQHAPTRQSRRNRLLRPEVLLLKRARWIGDGEGAAASV